jgi:hypothetical protein
MKQIIASKQSTKAHLVFCPYAQNIKKDDNAIYFDSKADAQRFKFDFCKCLHFFEPRKDEVGYHLKEKFAVLQHIDKYTDPIKAVEHFTS